MAKALWITFIASLLHATTSFHVRWLLGGNTHSQRVRKLAQHATTAYYFNTSSVDILGSPNPEAAIGNPLKGLVPSVDFSNYDPAATSIDASLEFVYVPLDELMFGNPDVIGAAKAFNWTFLETHLEGARSRNRHLVMTPFVHFPNWGRMSVPQYLLDAGMKTFTYTDFLGGGESPDYGDAQLLKALDQFIAAFGAKYDGDKRLAFVSMGLLGYWGEWHTFPHDYVPESSRESVLRWYVAAFPQTKIQARYPTVEAHEAGLGFADSSFAFHTVDGPANGGVDRDYYFWTMLEELKITNFWKRGPMGGETRPELQHLIFKPDYVPGFEKQDFMQTVETTHTTYMFHQHAFIEGGYEGEELKIASHAHAAMGYNFVVSNVGVSSIDSSTVRVDVTVTQDGVAPFYYPLSLSLHCSDLKSPVVQSGVEKLIEKGATKVFTFTNVPATAPCLDHVKFSLDSDYSFTGRPIKFAQGTDGIVAVKVPMPPTPLLVNFTLMQVVDGVGSAFDSVENGQTFDLADVGYSLSLEAKANRDLDSGIEFHYNRMVQPVGSAPFALGGLSNGDFTPVPYLTTIGMKTVSAVVRSAAGTVIANQTVSFRIVDTSSPLTASPTPAPTLSPTVATLEPTTMVPTVSPTLSPTEDDTGTIKLQTAAPTLPPVTVMTDAEKSNMTVLHGFNTDKTPPQLDLVKRNIMDKRTTAMVVLGSLMLGTLLAGMICCMILRNRRRKDFGDACDESVKDDQATMANSSAAFSSSFARSQSTRTFFDDDDPIPKPAFTFNMRPAVTRQPSMGTVYDDDKTVVSISYNGPRRKRLKNVTRVSKEDKAKIDMMLKGNESYV